MPFREFLGYQRLALARHVQRRNTQSRADWQRRIAEQKKRGG